MTATTNKIFSALAVLTIILTVMTGGCKKDASPQAKTVYQLAVKGQLGVSGTITFTQTSSTVTTVAITLTGADSAYHPAYIRSNSAAEGGAVAITLNPVVGGLSSTQVSMLDNTNSVSYSQLIQFDGYADVDESATNLTLIIAEGDIGGNALTTTKITYPLDTVGTLGVSGTAVFAKRANGNTLLTIALTGTIAGGTYPAAIYLGSVASVGGGPLEKTLNAVSGGIGTSYTTIRTLNDGTVATYANLLVYDGYLEVQQSTTNTSALCQGNIGTH